ncbi:hypothetical protein BJ912DRAFT_1048573 [Pholiota molesta]|nr:hypothetical protein BJ912DRAFT_1048573 [Pholiota molesta]
MKLKEIHRTSTFAWSPSAALPLLATGTVAGALDESFSNESQLEIWAPDFLDNSEFDLGVEGQHGPKGYVTDTARFNRLAWGHVDASRPHGVIAAGLENGELALWDPAKILAGAPASDSLILRNTTHTGPVRGLDFNPLQTSLLASGAVGGEVYIWDLKDPSKPYSPTPGQRSSKLDEITSVAWNQQSNTSLPVQAARDTLKREVVALAYGGGAGTLAGLSGSGAGMAVGGRRGMSDIAWHPDNATRLVTASEDDSSPVIMVWDLRNARVLSLSWCKQDATSSSRAVKTTALFAGTPNFRSHRRTPISRQLGVPGRLVPSQPDMLATAFFDGTIGIHSIQSTNEATAAAGKSAAAPRVDGADIFDAPGFSRSSPQGTLSLKQPPSGSPPGVCFLWIRRQARLIENLPPPGKAQSSVVHLRKVVTETDLVERAREDGNHGGCVADCWEGWKALLSLFKADSRDELVTLLGFSKTEIAARVAEAVENLKAAADAKAIQEDDTTLYGKPHESVVSFAEPESQELPSDQSEAGDEAGDDLTPVVAPEEQTPSEVSTGITSDTASATLFGDDIPGTPHHDFFNTVGVAQEDGESHAVLVPHVNYGFDSSVAATIGSGPQQRVPHLPLDESDIDRLVTKALVLGDFESAVSLCLSADRFADAILLAVRGGPELLQRTQRAYFARRTTTLPYLQRGPAGVARDLRRALHLREPGRVSGARGAARRAPGGAGGARAGRGGRRCGHGREAYAFRKNATLTYLASARLERLVGIWAAELAEEEAARVADARAQDGTYYSAHALALQTFVEKVTVFRAATKYKDEALEQDANGAAPQAFKLAPLYDRYFEYAEILSTQGLVKEAVRFLKLTPAAYKGLAPGADLDSKRKRLIQATTAGPVASTSTAAAPAAVPARSVPAPATRAAYGAPTTWNAPAQPISHQPPATYPSYEAPSNPYAPTAAQTQPVYAPHLRAPAPPAPASIPPPPARAANGTPSNAGPPPPPKRDNGGWNDPPAALPASRAPPALNLHKPAVITSPFPHAAPSPGFSSPQGSPARPAAPAAAPHAEPVRAAPAARPRAGADAAPRGQFNRPPPPGQQQGHLQQQQAPSAYRAASPAGPYGPPAGGVAQQAGPPPPGPYAPPQGMQQPQQRPGPSQGQHPPQAAGGPPRQEGRRPPASCIPSAAESPSRTQPPAPKYPPGDRSHIPDYAQPAYNSISDIEQDEADHACNQKRILDDLERRINPLFDGLNCETISRSVVDQLTVLTRAMDAHDRPAALAIHVELLTRGSQTDDIGLWMSGIKQLIMRL